MHLDNIIKVIRCLDRVQLSCLLFLGFIQSSKILLELQTLQMGGTVDKVVVHSRDEVKQLLLEHLDAVHELAEHHLVLEVEPLPRAHIFNLILIILRIAIAVDILFQQVWLFEVEVPLLH